MAKVAQFQNKSATNCFIGTEVKLGTATAADGAWLQMPITDYSFSEINLQTLDVAPFRIGQGVGMTQSDKMVKAKRHDRMFEISLNFIATKHAIDRICKNLFEDGDGTNTLIGTMPTTVTFKHSVSNAVPVTIIFDEGGHTFNDIYFTSCMCTSFTLNGSIDSDGGTILGTATFVTGYPPVEGSLTPDASDTAVSAQTVFNVHEFSTTTIGGSGGDLVFHGFELTIARSVTKQSFIPGAEFRPYGYSIGGYEVTGSITGKRDANSLAAIAENTAKAIVLTDGTFDIQCPTAYVDTAAIDFADTGWLQTIPFRALYTGAATSTICSITTS